MNTKNSVLETKVIDNMQLTMLDTFRELLPLSKSLDMAVGYFYISGFDLLREIFEELTSNGHVRIIMGNRTDEATAYEIKYGVDSHSTKDVLNPIKSISREVSSIKEDSQLAYSAHGLADLISAGLVKIRVYTGPADYFHAKAYLMGRENLKYDGYAIVGSSNFSRGGLTNNSELNVLTMDSYANLRQWFDKLWESEYVEDFSIDLIEIIKNTVIKPRNYRPPASIWTATPGGDKGVPYFPNDITLRKYQEKAIDDWFNNGHNGTFKMATGSGKTITSLGLTVRANIELDLKAVIIIAPYCHLVSQWSREVKKFNMLPICCYESYTKWGPLLKSKLYGINAGNIPFLSVITTNATFVSEGLQALLQYFPQNTLIIGDEVHNLGAKSFRKSLPENINFRLGLSATPERWFDDTGTKEIFDYFGEKLVEFTLKDALDCKALVPYRYKPIFIHLTEDEGLQYLELSRKIAQVWSPKADLENSMVTALMNQRARLVASAQNKLIELRKLMQNRLNTSHTLVYVGDGTVEEPASDETVRQIDAVCKILGYDLGFRVDRYVADTPLDERENLRIQFDSGALQGLVAIRCLDEGVDIPSIQTAIILASSSNPRQFVQRRGRVLRKYEGKEEALIYDMITLPPDDVIKYKSEKSMIQKEIDRFVEFASLAVNAGEVIGELSAIKQRYRLA